MEEFSEKTCEAAVAPVKISTRGLNLSYGDRPALKDISFDMAEKNVTAFIGP